MENSDHRLRRLPMIGMLLAAMLALPSLRAPLLQDDVAHRTFLEGRLPGVRWGALELYDFVGGPTRPVTRLRESGYMPWFVEEDLKLRFFRPLSSALVAADWAILGDRAWVARLHSLAWFVALVALVGAVHRRVLAPRTAALATLIFAVAEGHTVPVSWIAARHTLVATTFAAVSVWLYLRARDDGWSPGRWLSPAALIVGLLAGEMALGAVAFTAARELSEHRGTRTGRLRALLPTLVVGVAYLVFYVTAGYGVRGGRAYIGPDSGMEGAIAAVRHYLILIGELVAATPSDAFVSATASVQAGAAAWGTLMIGIAWLLIVLLRAHVDRRDAAALRWLCLAAALAAAPGALAVVGGRVLTFALFPASGAVAALLLAGWSALRKRNVTGLRRAFAAITIAGLAFGHLVSAPLIRWTLAGMLADLARAEERIAAATPPCPGVMVLPVASDPTVAVYVPGRMVLNGVGPRRLRVLSMAAADHRIENVTRSGFDLVMLDEAYRPSLWEQVYRRTPLSAGTRVTIPALDAHVIEDRDGMPTRVRFDFGEPLDSPALCFYRWQDGRLSRMAVPAPGETVLMPHVRGPGGW